MPEPLYFMSSVRESVDYIGSATNVCVCTDEFHLWHMSVCYSTSCDEDELIGFEVKMSKVRVTTWPPDMACVSEDRLTHQPSQWVSWEFTSHLTHFRARTNTNDVNSNNKPFGQGMDQPYSAASWTHTGLNGDWELDTVLTICLSVFVVLSWFISPILAGIVSVSLFFICKYFILNKVSLCSPVTRAMWLMLKQQ